MSKECEDQFDLFDENLHEASLETLTHWLELVSSCKLCDGCSGQVKMLERLIEQKEKSNGLY